MKLLLALLPALVLANVHDDARSKLVDEINATPGVTWKAGHNERFKGQPLDGVKSLCGVKPESAAAVAELPTVFGAKRGTLDIPDSFDSATNWPQCAESINNIRDQSNCGCCWAFAGVEAASDRLCINTNSSILVPLSSQEMCFCGSMNGCDGGTVNAPWNQILNFGITTGGQYNNTGDFGGGWCSKFSLPHCHHHGPQRNDPYPPEGAPGCPEQTSPACPQQCDSDAVAPHNDFQADRYTFDGMVQRYGDEAGIQAAIMGQGPVEAAFTVYEDFANYVSGVYKFVSGAQMGGHAIRIVGWGVDNSTKYWRIANSWNPYWGENGYFRIVRGTNECGIESSVIATSAEAVWHLRQGPK